MKRILAASLSVLFTTPAAWACDEPTVRHLTIQQPIGTWQWSLLLPGLGQVMMNREEVGWSLMGLNLGLFGLASALTVTALWPNQSQPLPWGVAAGAGWLAGTGVYVYQAHDAFRWDVERSEVRVYLAPSDDEGCE